MKERDQGTQRETRQKERKSWSELCFEKITLGVVGSMDEEGQGGVMRPQSPVIPPATSTAHDCSVPTFSPGQNYGC